MKLLSVIFSIMLAGIFFSGCHTTAGTSVVMNHETGGSVIYEGNTRLHNSVAVTAVTYDKVPAGLNRVNIQLTSLVQRELHLQYRIAWFNAEGMEIDRDDLLRRLVDIQFTRNDFEPERGTFRVRGEVVEIIPAASEKRGVRVEFFGDEIERISEVDMLTGKPLRFVNHVLIFPASHYATSKDKLDRCISNAAVFCNYLLLAKYKS